MSLLVIRRSIRSFRRFQKYLNFRLVNLLKGSALLRNTLHLPRSELWNDDTWRSQPGINYTPIHESKRLRRQPPRYVDRRPSPRFAPERERISKPTFVASIRRAQVMGSDGFIFLSERPIPELCINFMGPLEIHPVFTSFFLSRPHYIGGRSLSIATSSGDSYFHFVTDAVPRVKLLYQAGYSLNQFDHIIVNGARHNFQRDFLSALGIPGDKCIYLNENSNLICENLVVPSPPAISGNPPGWACNFIRTLCANISTEPRKRIYISRDDAIGRRVINEAEVVDFLKPMGFSKVSLTGMSLEAQAKLFAGAEVIVAPHGAGLTNLVFSTAGTKVIEFFSPHYINVCYWALSEECKILYGYLIGEGPRPKEENTQEDGRANIQVSLDELSRLLSLMNIQMPEVAQIESTTTAT